MKAFSTVCMIFLALLVSPVVRAEAVSATVTADAISNVCHPQPDPEKNQYLVGYGSLMQQASRTRTAPNAGDVVPVRVHGFRRAWIARGSPNGFSTTFLGVSENAQARMNAVLFALPEQSEIARMDERERGYCRVGVSAAQITALDSAALPAGQRWIYVNKPQNTAPPSSTHPIVQSYVDVFLSGCLEVERAYQLQGFAHECLTSTHGWSKHWVNDRIYPRRPFIHQPDAAAIDALLQREMPARFRSIRIE